MIVELSCFLIGHKKTLFFLYVCRPVGRSLCLFAIAFSKPLAAFMSTHHIPASKNPEVKRLAEQQAAAKEHPNKQRCSFWIWHKTLRSGSYQCSRSAAHYFLAGGNFLLGSLTMDPYDSVDR